MARRNLIEDSNFQKYLIEHNIEVQPAPRGMSRQKSNQTRTTNKNNTLWTVEWIDVAGVSNLRHDCMGSESIRDLHTAAKRALRQAEKRGRTGDAAKAPLSKKRRSQQKAPETMTASKLPGDSVVDADQSRISDAAKPGADEPSPAAVSEQPVAQANTAKQSSGTVQRADENHHFYLLKPATAVSSKVLVPLDAQLSLTETLRGQTVLEYPTIYVLSHAPNALPTGFMLEEQYTQLRKREDDELREAMRKADENGVPDRADAGPSSAKVDPNKILDMLKRDISR